MYGKGEGNQHSCPLILMHHPTSLGSLGEVERSSAVKSHSAPSSLPSLSSHDWFPSSRPHRSTDRPLPLSLPRSSYSASLPEDRFQNPFISPFVPHSLFPRFRSFHLSLSPRRRYSRRKQIHLSSRESRGRAAGCFSLATLSGQMFCYFFTRPQSALSSGSRGINGRSPSSQLHLANERWGEGEALLPPPPHCSIGIAVIELCAANSIRRRDTHPESEPSIRIPEARGEFLLLEKTSSGLFL